MARPWTRQGEAHQRNRAQMLNTRNKTTRRVCLCVGARLTCRVSLSSIHKHVLGQGRGSERVYKLRLDVMHLRPQDANIEPEKPAQSSTQPTKRRSAHSDLNPNSRSLKQTIDQICKTIDRVLNGELANWLENTGKRETILKFGWLIADDELFGYYDYFLSFVELGAAWETQNIVDSLHHSNISS
ncbi:hypothetical protein CAOG_08352 [Capsaspora owczarzaki ATCC 30864]|uniref:hypothetical protein n=1 Tax=Capsaspora owczarzaki (strain ATCC 30864) TaxID=595528 RepID=UPI0001FE3095|nr:hypothetical protein CAOG_08352 [Capsaspora owczarzaki ATCC 30864]|eukprot:XP_004340771.1 hypothetical protein CAOG_08352 [Capsaspora owczarzaki ATCC 30864]